MSAERRERHEHEHGHEMGHRDVQGAAHARCRVRGAEHETIGSLMHMLGVFNAACRVPRPTVALCSFMLLVLVASPSVSPFEGTLAHGGQQETIQEDPRAMRFEPVEFKPPGPERLVLENGLVLYLLEDHELPLITISAVFQTGSWLDPQDKIGLAAITGHVMRSGGTARMAPEEVDGELEHIAADISVGIGVVSGRASLDVLKKDFELGLKIFVDILRTPRFDERRLALTKLQVIEGIRRRNDRPESIAGREFRKLLYGPAHPFARESTVASISGITREDVRTFHTRTVHPNGMILGVTGDFQKEELLARLRQVFGNWPQGKVPAIQLPALDADGASPGTDGEKLVRFVDKEASQAHLRVGHLSLKENDPDYPALAIANDILGGSSFRSRLFQDVRTRQGLAYSVGSGIRPGIWERGAWLMYAQTKVESTQQVVKSLLINVRRLREQPVTDVELEEAKESFVNSFVFSFSSPARIVNRLIGLEYDGLPRDFLQQLRDRVVKLTKDDLLRAARTHLHPERVRVLAVGSGEALRKLLQPFGGVQEIELEEAPSAGHK